MSGNLVDIQNLTFAYADKTVLSNITLGIPTGRVVAVMGSSGCGKTTLLRLIGGQLKPSLGTVTVMGESVAQLNTDDLFRLRRNMGMLFQMGGLFTDMSVFDNVAFQVREHTDLP